MKVDTVAAGITRSYPANWLMNGDKVAIRYFMETFKQVILGNRIYHFEIRNNVSMCWVDAADANQVLALTRGCESCGGGGRKTSMFYLANQDSIERWNGKV